MEIGRKTLLMNHENAYTRHIITIDDDMNAPDSKPDIDGRIKETGEVVIEKLRPLDGRIELGGQLKYRLLYQTAGGCDSINGSVPIAETIPAEGLLGQTILKCHTSLVDLKISIVNSRKINIKAVVALSYALVDTCEKEAISECRTENVLEQKKTVDIMQLISNKKDLFRIRESSHLPKDRVNVGKLLWQELSLKSLEYRPMAGSVGIKGEICMFCIYNGEDDPDTINYYDCVMPFGGEIQLTGCSEDTVLDISMNVADQSILVRPDENGEMRIIDGEMVLDMDVFAYKNCTETIMADVYSPSYSLVPAYSKAEYQSYVTRDSVRMRLEDRKKMETAVSSILNATGTLSIDEVVQEDDGVYLEGLVIADVLYMKSDGRGEMGCMRIEIPFSEKTGVSRLESDMQYSIGTGPVQISTYLTGTGELDIKCNATATLLVYRRCETDVMDSVECNKPDYAYIKNLPGIVGYVTVEGDTLWNIAKKYCTTIESIRQNNNFAGEEPAAGTKLIIIKAC